MPQTFDLVSRTALYTPAGRSAPMGVRQDLAARCVPCGEVIDCAGLDVLPA
jgi:hypothetical protein